MAVHKRQKDLRSIIGRKEEIKILEHLQKEEGPATLLVYGRRRVGKTFLIETCFHDKHLIKLEGIEGQSEQYQIQSVLLQFSRIIGEPYIAKLSFNTWAEFFELIAKKLKPNRPTILFFEEMQWLACYETRFIAELKYAWDNFFSKRKHFLLVLCGSSPSFMIQNVVRSKAFYNRSQQEIHLEEFSISEVQQFLGEHRSFKEVMDAVLTVGGVPEYLKRIRQHSSVFLGLVRNSFVKDSFFVGEYERIFTSGLASNRNYRKIIEYLGRRRHSTRNEILKYIKLESGGTVSQLLSDLSLSGLINRYVPFYLDSTSSLARYTIADSYVRFFNHFIRPRLEQIQSGRFDHTPAEALDLQDYEKWLGLAFEFFCRKNHWLIARELGFGSVDYRSGAYFKRSHDQNNGLQIDLVFERRDRVLTICEIKYTQDPVGSSVVREFRKKLECFEYKKKYSLHKVLISASGATSDVLASGEFNQILTLEDLFSVR